ncbi:MAG: hypothetical protein OEZ34_06340, partial [Spirochaetia bacterium]|nr:hypothetical protein [Spirochaetia bacterium]
MKIKSITIAAVFTILTAFIPSCSKTETKNSLPAPQITGSIDGNSIRFKIIIPENHHAYLDRGKEGRL